MAAVNPIIKIGSILFLVTLLGACVTPRPIYVEDACQLLAEHPPWRVATEDSYRHWGVPVAVQLAVMRQESGFKAKARPPRRKIIGMIPGSRPSTAYGYCQAKDETWQNYQTNTKQRLVSRTNFHDAADFVGWYANNAHRRLHIPPNDAYHFYLAYHEGLGGYERKTYMQKPWLVQVAKKVRYRAGIYDHQLERCLG